MLLPICGLLLFLESSYGHILTHNFGYWHPNFTYKVEDFLKKKDVDISAQCKQHLSRYLQGLRSGEEWAMRMFDASAKFPPSGMLDGNLVELGSFDECLGIEQHGSEAQIFGKYCIGKIQINTNFKHNQKHLPLNPLISYLNTGTTSAIIDIYLAKCFPDACSTVEAEKVYTAIGFEITFEEGLCQTKASQPKLDGGSIAVIIVFGIILLIVFISTGYDLINYYLEKEPSHSMLLAFSAFTNGRKLINTSKTNEISCLHGIRVFGTIWVIAHHSYLVSHHFPIRNLFYFYQWLNAKENLIVHSTHVIDTFFLLSGLLISYNYMSALKKGVKFNIILHYVHRYLRLTPSLAVMVVFHITLLRHMGMGPLWPKIMEKELIGNCETYWWKNLLYIQNIFLDKPSTCMNHSWYLATDMQLFILSPLLLIPLKKWPKITLSVIGFLAACTIVTCFLIGWFFKLHSYTLKNQGRAGFLSYMSNYYYPVYTRGAPWFIGIALGYIIFESRGIKLNFLENKVIVMVLWAASLTIMHMCVFAGHGIFIAGEYNRLANSLHLALVRPVWTIAVAWIIFSCAKGYGGPINRFLSLPTFQVVSPLTYSVYLVHYPVLYITTGQNRTTTLFSNFQTICYFCGNTVCILAVSLIIVLAIEFPMVAINKVLFPQKQKSKLN